MILYFQSKVFPKRTFTAVVESHYTIARVRARLLHLLYDIGNDDYQFRLKFDGQYLNDSLTLDDYKIMSSAVITIAPLSAGPEEQPDKDGLSSASSFGGQYSLRQALRDEIGLLNKRESILKVFQVFVHFSLLGSILGLVSVYWYSCFWLFGYYLVLVSLCPSFTREAGFTGHHSVSPKTFCKTFGIVTPVVAAASVYLSYREISFSEAPAYSRYYTAALFAGNAAVMIACDLTIWTLLYNLKFEIGDKIETFLCQTRSLDVVLNSAVNGKILEKRMAAFDLSTLAASSDDNKFMIAADGGLSILVRLALSADVATQEFAVETLAEMLTVPAIQDSFVAAGHVHTLTALLHSPNPNVVSEAATAISYIVADSETNRFAVVDDQGWIDLVKAANSPLKAVQRTVAGIFLDLAFHEDIRLQIMSMNTPAQALVHLAQSADAETRQLTLQTLELLAISSAEFVCSKLDLLDVILGLPGHSRTQRTDEKTLLIACKLLLYFAENKESCKAMAQKSNFRHALARYAQINNMQMQKMVAKIAYCTAELPQLRDRARALHLEQILIAIRERATDRELWTMADQGLSLLTLGSEDDRETPVF